MTGPRDLVVILPEEYAVALVEALADCMVLAAFVTDTATDADTADFAGRAFIKARQLGEDLIEWVRVERVNVP